MDFIKNFAFALIQAPKNNLIYKSQEQPQRSSKEIKGAIDTKNVERKEEISRLAAMNQRLDEVTTRLDGVKGELVVTLKEKAAARSELKAMESQGKKEVDLVEKARLLQVVDNYSQREQIYRELLRTKTELPGEIKGQEVTVSRIDAQIRQAKMDLGAQLAQERQAAAGIRARKSREAAQARLARYQEAVKKEEQARRVVEKANREAEKVHKQDVQKSKVATERFAQEENEATRKQVKDLLIEDSLADYEAFDAAMNTYEEQLARRTAQFESDTATALVENQEGNPTINTGKTTVSLRERTSPRAAGEVKRVIPPNQEVKLVVPFIPKANGEIWAQVANEKGEPKGTYVAVKYKGNTYFDFTA